MRNRSLAPLLAFAAFICAASAVYADEAADHAALQAMVKEYEAAIEKSDPSVLRPYLTPDFTGVMVTGEEVNDFQSLETYWNKIQRLLGNDGKYSVKINLPAPATIVGDVAYAHGTTDDTAVTSAGKEYRFQGFWTAVCRREGASWKIARIHGSMDAITNPFVTSAIRSAAMPAAIIGILLGSVLGAFVFWTLARRRTRVAVSG